MYKIYKKNNYLIIDDSVTTPEEYLTKDILIKEIVTNVTYEIYGILPRLGNTSNQLLYTVNIANIIKENDSPYTANEWVDFYTSSTGVPSSNSGGGGGGGGGSSDTTEATQLLIKAEQVEQTAALAAIKTATEALDAKIPALVDGKTVVTTTDTVVQAIPDPDNAADIATAWGNFTGVNWAGGDFVTSVSGLNGQSITVMSSSPLTTGESYAVNYSKAVLQPCAFEFAGSFKQTGVSFATAVLFANDPVTGPDTVPSPINIISAYQSSAVDGASYNAVSGTVLHLVLESALPSAGSNQAVFVGDWVNITGFADSRINYSNACIAFISADRKTISVTFSNEAALPSLAIAAITPTLGTAKVHFYNNMSGARNGFGLRFTGTNAIAAAVVSIFGGDDNQTSGTLRGDQRTTVSNCAPNYVSGATWGQYEVRASSRYRLETTPSAATLYDKPEQSATLWNLRDAPRTSVKPASGALLYPRFRLYKPVNMTRPIGKIVSISKAGTTTATINLHAAPAEALAVGNVVVLYGVRDQTNFVNSTATITAVLSPTQFQAVVGSAVTATSYGGSCSIVNGGGTQPGIIAQQVSSVVSRVAEGSNWLDVIGGATWSGLSLGDYVDLYGVRESVAGTNVGVDGAWEVAHLSATTMVLKPVFDIAGNRVSPALGTLASVNCGGAVIIRPTLRAHNLSVSSWTEAQVQIDGQGTTDPRKALPMFGIGGSITSVQGTAATITSDGSGGWPIRPSIAGVADVASATITSTATSASILNDKGNGFQVTFPVTAVTGTSPTLDIRIEESFDAGANWVTLYEMQRITALGSYNTPILRATGRNIRYVRTITGTSPSFTMAITRNLLPFIQAEPQKRIIDRSVVTTTLNAVTPTLFQGAANNVQLVVNMGAITTTAPAFQIEGSEDGTNFYAIGTPLTAVASSTVEVTVNKSATFVRARVSTAGVGSTLGYVSLKAWS